RRCSPVLRARARRRGCRQRRRPECCRRPATDRLSDRRTWPAKPGSGKRRPAPPTRVCWLCPWAAWHSFVCPLSLRAHPLVQRQAAFVLVGFRGALAIPVGVEQVYENTQIFGDRWALGEMPEVFAVGLGRAKEQLAAFVERVDQ